MFAGSPLSPELNLQYSNRDKGQGCTLYQNFTIILILTCEIKQRWVYLDFFFDDTRWYRMRQARSLSTLVFTYAFKKVICAWIRPSMPQKTSTLQTKNRGHPCNLSGHQRCHHIWLITSPVRGGPDWYFWQEEVKFNLKPERKFCLVL